MDLIAILCWAGHKAEEWADSGGAAGKGLGWD